MCTGGIAERTTSCYMLPRVNPFRSWAAVKQVFFLCACNVANGQFEFEFVERNGWVAVFRCRCRTNITIQSYHIMIGIWIPTFPPQPISFLLGLGHWDLELNPSSHHLLYDKLEKGVSAELHWLNIGSEAGETDFQIMIFGIHSLRLLAWLWWMIFMPHISVLFSRTLKAHSYLSWFDFANPGWALEWMNTPPDIV
jgi:hypothetical protein